MRAREVRKKYTKVNYIQFSKCSMILGEKGEALFMSSISTAKEKSLGFKAEMS